MASKPRASLMRREFIPFILGDETITLSLCLPILDKLTHTPGLLSRIITEDDLIVQLLSNFDLYASRISQFFTILNRDAVSRAIHSVRRMSSVGPGIADALIEYLLFPILTEDFQQFQLQSPFLTLFASVIDFCLPYHPRVLEALGKRLQENEQLLRALVAGQSTSRIMTEWIGLFKITISDSKMLAVWTKTLIAQCQRCESDHKITDQVDRWHKLEDLIAQLTTIIDDRTNVRDAVRASEVSDANRGSNSTPRVQIPGLVFPPDIDQALRYFRIATPTSDRLLTHVLETLEKDEILSVLLATAASFPCRPCYETSTDPSVAKLYQRYEEDDWGGTGSFLFTDILGHGIGIWRVLVSALALKDMQDAYAQGDFNLVQSKLIQLASGEWMENSLCDRIGHSALYLAGYAGNGGILWQTDIEFDEKSETTTQLVKIWRVGDVKLILQAVRHILLIHKTYPPTRLDACNHVLIDRGTGKNLPASFLGDFGIDPTSTDRGSSVKGGPDWNPMEALFRNRFYLFTQSIVEDLRSGNTMAEYPLTLSKEELDIIKSATTSTIILGRSGTGKTTCLVYKLLGQYVFASRSGNGRQKRQVLLTRSSVLADKLGVYTKRLISTQLGEVPPAEEAGRDPLNLIEQNDREVTDTVFSIKEQDFPLVCTFNYFMKILENTARAANRKEFSITGQQSETGARIGSRRGRRLVRSPQVVDYEVFSGEYWPSFPLKWTKSISSTLAFMEIIGVIKGSACRLGKLDPLTRVEYRQGGYNISPVTVDRDMVYDLYEYYEKRKIQFSDVDDIDRVRIVMETISHNPELKQRIEGAFDEIYVDEIQDQRLMEIMMLLHLIKRPNAIHFGGDTAQAISKDSVFRFAHLKDLVYQRFEKSLTKPYELYKNYRTHQGIISVATCVMRLLIKCFPLLVDRLPDEIGQFSGPMPTVFVGFDAGVFSSRMFGAAKLDDEDAQFGAEQVIIVRDIEEKKKLKDAIGDFALILTVMESKGMEFEDVLLYDFLTTSTCISDYRALVSSVDSSVFDAAKHIALCSELKQLYVAITRAQNRLWVFENNESNLAPMLSLWMGGGPILEVAHIGDKNVKDKLTKLRPGTNANPEVWSAKGYEFILKKDYGNALFCFGRSKDSVGMNLVNAFIAEQKGNALLGSGDEDQATKCFRNAIKLFHKCGYSVREAGCYSILGEFEKAADIFSEAGEFGRAAHLFKTLNMFEKAAYNYTRARQYDSGASTLARGNLFDKLVYYLNDHGHHLDPARRLHYSRLCNLLLKRGKISPALRELTLAALRSDSEKEDFLKEFGMTSHLLAFYLDRRRYSDACSLGIENGDLDKVWLINEEHGGMESLPQQDRFDVFNHAQGKHLLPSLASNLEPNRIFSPADHSSIVCPWLSDNTLILEFWGSLQDHLDKLLTHRISYKDIAFPSIWMKQIFDLIIVIKASVFVNSARSVTELPIESINDVLSITDVMISTRIIPYSLCLLLRISPIKGDIQSYRILDASPLLAELDLQTPDAESTVRATIRWTLAQVCRAVDEAEENANSNYSRAEPCLTLFTRGKSISDCRLLGRCRSYHGQMTPTEYTTLVTDVLRVISVFYHIAPLYFKRFGELGPEGYSVTFTPRRRRWLERLITRLTYVSSFENDSQFLANTTRDMSQPNSANFGVFRQLQDHLFYRLNTGREWQEASFSFLLEQLQVSEALCLRQSFQRSLWFMANRMSPRTRKNWEAYKRIEYSLRFDINEYSVSTLDREIQALGSHELYSYHAICALYERMATFLIYKSHPSDFLLPNSWIELYLLDNPAVFSVEESGTPRSPKTPYRKALLSLTKSFCGLIRNVTADRQFCPEISGKPRKWELGHHVFVQRNADFLTCCLLNAFSWETHKTKTIHSKYLQMRFRVGQTLELPFAHSPGLVQFDTEYTRARSFVNALNRYAGKDGPRIIKATARSRTFFAFLESTVPTITLESLQPTKTSQDPTSGGQIPPSEIEPADNITNILPAVKTIQRVWKARYHIIRKRRVFSESPAGLAILYIQRICAAVVNDDLLERKERIWRRGIHFSEGLNIYWDIKAVQGLYQEKKAKVQARIDNAESGEMEVFQLQWERMLALRERVSRSEAVLSEPNWHELDLFSHDLSPRYRQILGDLEMLKLDLEMVDSDEKKITAAEIIQKMWRTRYPIVRKRRSYFNTPSGQAISYMYRMYQATVLESALDRKEQIRSAAVLFTEGQRVYGNVKTIERLYLMAKNTVRSRMAVSHGTDETRARDHSKRVSVVWHEVRRNADFLSQKNWRQVNISSRELKKTCSGTLTFLANIEDELHDLIAGGDDGDDG